MATSQLNFSESRDTDVKESRFQLTLHHGGSPRTPSKARKGRGLVLVAGNVLPVERWKLKSAIFKRSVVELTDLNGCYKGISISTTITGSLNSKPTQQLLAPSYIVLSACRIAN